MIEVLDTSPLTPYFQLLIVGIFFFAFCSFLPAQTSESIGQNSDRVRKEDESQEDGKEESEADLPPPSSSSPPQERQKYTSGFASSLVQGRTDECDVDYNFHV